jgi:hypothetical protein
LLDSDAFHDATDCQAEFDAGLIRLRGPDEPRLDYEFGDDSSEYANDGECDDPRFQGEGMATTALRDQDLMRDRTDCETAYVAGRIEWADPSATPSSGGNDVEPGDFGDDTSQWANDGECDDPRFEGPGMAAQAVEEDTGRDATDCRTALEAGRVTWKSEGATTEIDFGDDASQWANDGECDDERFEGSAMAPTPLMAEDVGHDATDCRTAYEAGELTLR